MSVKRVHICPRRVNVELLETVGLVELVDVPGKRKRKAPVVSYDEIRVSIPV